jgi:sugar phosphate isomerase/epimerase
MDLTQLDATTASALAAVRQQAETLGLFIELSAPPGSLASAEAYSEVARIARGVGASRLRMALLSGRRYETFESMAAWRVFADRWTRGLPAIAPAIDRERLQVGIENHKDWLAVELAGILRGIGSEYLGACVDFGNNLSLLEDPMATVEALAPYAVTTHLKDMAVRVDGEGFELSEVPLGEGVLPVPRMIETIRRARPDVHFCLEMITRDPLAVPYKRDAYWVAFETKDAPAVAAFERGILAKARRDLPRTSGLTAEAAVALEDVRRCAVHAKDVLKL